MKFLINTIVAAVIIALVTELSRRFSFLAALLISLPLTSIVAMAFVYAETKDVAKVSELSLGVFWLVIPSLGMFLLLPFLLRQGMNFWLSLAISCGALAAFYPAYAAALKQIGVKL